MPVTLEHLSVLFLEVLAEHVEDGPSAEHVEGGPNERPYREPAEASGSEAASWSVTMSFEARVPVGCL